MVILSRRREIPVALKSRSRYQTERLYGGDEPLSVPLVRKADSDRANEGAADDDGAGKEGEAREKVGDDDENARNSGQEDNQDKVGSGDKEDKGIVKSVCFILNCTFGVGAFALPVFARRVGIVVMVLTVLIGGLFTYYANLMIVRTAHEVKLKLQGKENEALKTDTYNTLYEYAVFNKGGYRVAAKLLLSFVMCLIIVLSVLGYFTAIYVYLGDLARYAFPHYNAGPLCFVVIFAAIAVFAAAQAYAGNTSPTFGAVCDYLKMFGAGCGFASLFTVIVYCIVYCVRVGRGRNVSIGLPSETTNAGTLGIILTILGGVCPPVVNSFNNLLGGPEQAFEYKPKGTYNDHRFLFQCACVLITLMYGCLFFFGYLAFGDGYNSDGKLIGDSNIIDSLSSPYKQIAQVLSLIGLTQTIAFFAARLAPGAVRDIWSLCATNSSRNRNATDKLDGAMAFIFVGLTGGVILITGGKIDFGLFVQLSGAVCATLLMFIFPPLLNYFLTRNERNRFPKLAVFLFMAFGVIICVSGIISVFSSSPAAVSTE